MAVQAPASAETDPPLTQGGDPPLTQGGDPPLTQGGDPPLTDWALRLFLASPIAPLWTGVSLAVLLTAASQLFRFFWEPAELRFAPMASSWLLDTVLWLDFLNATLLAYILVAMVYLRRARLGDLRALRPSLRLDDAAFQQGLATALSVPPLRLALWGALGACVFGSIPLVDPDFWGGALAPSVDEPLVWALVGRSAVTGWMSGHALVSEYRVTRSLHRLGRDALHVDLLNLDAVSPLARASQRGAFVWVLGASLVSLFWLGPAAGSANTVIVPVMLLLVILSFYGSVSGAHRSIVAQKQQTLAALEERIRAGAPGLLTGEGREAGLGDAIAFHGFVARLREWPFDTPLLLRWALIAALGLGSWLGGALVEQLLERTIG